MVGRAGASALAAGEAGRRQAPPPRPAPRPLPGSRDASVPISLCPSHWRALLQLCGRCGRLRRTMAEVSPCAPVLRLAACPPGLPSPAAPAHGQRLGVGGRAVGIAGPVVQVRGWGCLGHRPFLSFHAPPISCFPSATTGQGRADKRY